MFHHKLIELESELVAKEQSKKGLAQLPPECDLLLEHVERQVEVRLGHLVHKGWKGWLSYRRNKQSLVVCRGAAFKEGFMGKWKAGLDVPYGLDTITEHARGFDVSPPQGLDHLLVNFGGDEPRVFLWYGENIAPYKLIFVADMAEEPEQALSEAIVEACTWIMRRPQDKTLTQFLAELE